MPDACPTNDIATLRRWLGNSETRVDVISTAWCRRMEETLGREPTLRDGDPLPPLWHTITHLTSVPLHQLGPDGHPKRGGFLPPIALARRMWAGGRFVFGRPILLGEQVTKTSTITDIEMKTGRTGSLCFVTLNHKLDVDGEVCLAEDQDLVFLDPANPDAPQPELKRAPIEHDFRRTVTPSEVMLFRYSALTFNSHRIHYDRAYARAAEGYRDLVFHGPLTATLLAEMAEAETGRTLAEFSFRGLAPLFVTEPFTISGHQDGPTVDLWASTPSGGLAMQAQARLS